jgi:hypothetical protein
MMTRREFVAGAGAAAGLKQLAAAPTTRPNVGQIDRERILRGAAVAAVFPVAGQAVESAEFLAFSLSIPSLAAASVIDAANAAKYGAAAGVQLEAWFVNAPTRLQSAPLLSAFEQILERAALAELCVAIGFLTLDPALLAEIKGWFATYLRWLMENRTALLARDARDRHGSSWLLQVAAAATLTGDEGAINECRHRFKTVTVRAQIGPDGLFQHELMTDSPYRNSLFNLDLLAGVCQLLSTQFESLWDHELQDGPGMRAAVAKHAFYIGERNKWPFPADSKYFTLLPYRRPALVFGGRAYSNAEYVTAWRKLNPDPTEAGVLRTFPIRQPVLWLPGARRAS